MKNPSETESRYSFGEAVADLARNFATAPFVPSDSAEFMRLCIEWAENFEARNKGRQWDGEFIEEIDRHFHAEFEAWLASASDCNANPSWNAPAVRQSRSLPLTRQLWLQHVRSSERKLHGGTFAGFMRHFPQACLMIENRKLCLVLKPE